MTRAHLPYSAGQLSRVRLLYWQNSCRVAPVQRRLHGRSCVRRLPHTHAVQITPAPFRQFWCDLLHGAIHFADQSSVPRYLLMNERTFIIFQFFFLSSDSEALVTPLAL